MTTPAPAPRRRRPAARDLEEDDASRVALASPTPSPDKPGGGRPDPPGIEASPWFTAGEDEWILKE